VIGAELHLDVEAVLWQETTAWQEGSDSATGNGDVTFPLLQCPELVALPSQQGSLSVVPKAHLWIRTWVAQRHQAMSPLVQPGLHMEPLVSITCLRRFDGNMVNFLCIVYFFPLKQLKERKGKDKGEEV